MPVPFVDAAPLLAALSRRSGRGRASPVSDHITSARRGGAADPRHAALCRERGVPVVIDGAHAPASSRSTCRRSASIGMSATCTNGRSRERQRGHLVRPRASAGAAPDRDLACAGCRVSGGVRLHRHARTIRPGSPHRRRSIMPTPGRRGDAPPITPRSRAKRGDADPAWDSRRPPPQISARRWSRSGYPALPGVTRRAHRLALRLNEQQASLPNQCSTAGCGSEFRRKSTRDRRLPAPRGNWQTLAGEKALRRLDAGFSWSNGAARARARRGSSRPDGRLPLGLLLPEKPI